MREIAEQTVVGLRKVTKELGRKKFPNGHILVEAFKAIEGSLQELFPSVFSRQGQQASFYTCLRELREKENIPENLFYDILRVKTHRDNGAAHRGPTPSEHDALFARATLAYFLHWVEEKFGSSVKTPAKRKVPIGLPIYRELMEYVARNPGFCDDCISQDTELQPRQRVRYYLLRLEEQGVVLRSEGYCPGCDDSDKQRTEDNYLAG